MAQKCHPDHGGSTEQMQELNYHKLEVEKHYKYKKYKNKEEQKEEWETKEEKYPKLLKRIFNNKRLSEFGVKNLSIKDKGSLGKTVESIIYGIKTNNSPKMDLEDNSLEIKTFPLKNTKKGLKAKERMVLGMINNSINEESFLDSKLYKKCQSMIVNTYIDEKDKGIKKEDYLFKNCFKIELKNLSFFDEIENDWNFIKNQVTEYGMSSLKSEQTKYLKACTKSNGRAFSFSTTTMNKIIEELTIKE